MAGVVRSRAVWQYDERDWTGPNRAEDATTNAIRGAKRGVGCCAFLTVLSIVPVPVSQQARTR